MFLFETKTGQRNVIWEKNKKQNVEIWIDAFIFKLNSSRNSQNNDNGKKNTRAKSTELNLRMQPDRKYCIATSNEDFKRD